MATNRYGMKYLADAREPRNLLRGFPRSMYVPTSSQLRRKYRMINPVRNAFVILNAHSSQTEKA